MSLFSDNLKKLRSMHEITANKISEQLQVNIKTYFAWETARGVPDLNMIVRIADFYNITTDQLIKGWAEQPATMKAEEVFLQRYKTAPKTIKETITILLDLKY